MKTEYLRTLRRHQGQIIGWGISMALLGLYLFQFYDTIAAQREQIESLIQSYPRELMAFFGDMTQIFTPQGYLNSYFFSYVPLVLGIFAVLAGSGLLAGDEENGSLDLLLAHPISRARFFLARTLAFEVSLLGILALSWLGFVVGIRGSSLEIGLLELWLPLLSLFGLLSFYGSLALVFSMILPARRLAAMAGGIVVVADYFITALSRLDPDLHRIAQYMPQHFYQGGGALAGLDYGLLLPILGGSLALLGIAWWRFQRKDIRVGGEGSFRLRLLPTRGTRGGS